MSGAAPHGPHMQDVEAHVRAVESDFEYFRTKRLEPRLFFLMRRGLLSVSELLEAGRDVSRPAPGPVHPETEARVRALEDRLDAFISAIATMSVTSLKSGEVVIEDVRKERGDYDGFFRIAKRRHDGSLEQRIEQVENELADCMHVIGVINHALLTSGELTEEQLRAQRAAIEQQGYRNGARIVARAWVDPEFKRRLIATGREAVRELDIPPGRLGKLGVAENTDEVHHVVVCTLCSCYPIALLGPSPSWYKSEAYRSRVVRDPRAVLAEFGLTLPDTVEIRVWDASAETRYLVLPRRPAGTDEYAEYELAGLVTRAGMIGTAAV
jgi:nitrile hydratase subunit alpha